MALEPNNQRDGQETAPNASDEATQRDRRTLNLLLIVGVFALVFGSLQILNAIRNPLSLRTGTNTNTTLGQSGTAIAALSGQDTDADGLNDYDELYVYQTSPYLADSDSDGQSDQAEISGGTDPNCPTGETCSGLVTTNGTTNAATNGNTNGALANLTNGLPTNGLGLTPDELRQALRNAGAPASTLESIDDTTLLQLYQEVVGTSGTNTNTAGNSTANTNVTLPSTIDPTTLQNLSPDQIREFLRQGGADAQMLEQVDDETLRAIFEEALADLNTNGS